MSLTAFGFVAVGTMFVTYWIEDRSAWFVLVFAAACAASAFYGLLAGAAPFAVVEIAVGRRRAACASASAAPHEGAS